MTILHACLHGLRVRALCTHTEEAEEGAGRQLPQHQHDGGYVQLLEYERQ